MINNYLKKGQLHYMCCHKIQNQIGINKVFRYGNFFYYDFLVNDFERNIANKILKTELVKIPGVAQVLSKDEIINRKMLKCARNLQFEEAAILRDQIDRLKGK